MGGMCPSSFEFPGGPRTIARHLRSAIWIALWFGGGWASGQSPVLENVEVVDSPAVTPEDDANSGPKVSLEGVKTAEQDEPVHPMLAFSRLFGPSPLDNLESSIDSPSPLPETPQYVLQPVSNPLSVVQVITRPVREANLLLPKQLDPFYRKTPREIDELEREEIEAARIQKIAQQRRLLAVTSDARGDLTNQFDNDWHFQVQAGGSFREGNNPGASINSQLRAEKHSLHDTFVSRVGGFYNQLEGGTTTQRVFGQGTYDRHLRGRWLAYVREDIEWDTARLINIRSISSVGVGFRFIDTVRERLVGRLGPTGTYIDYDHAATNQDEGKSGWLIEGDYRRLIGESTRLEWVTSAFPDFDTDQAFRVRTEAALIFPIGKATVWNWKVGLRHEYTMNPVSTTVPHDVEGYFSIVYTK